MFEMWRPSVWSSIPECTQWVGRENEHIEFFKENTGSQCTISKVRGRPIPSLPGQALGYKIGQLRIQETSLEGRKKWEKIFRYVHS